ncbi:MAG: acyltransferase family protein, partial [Beutenbergiaceae bacterium]
MAGSAQGFRPEVQGLRAIAVGVVVLFHLWPLRMPGGYVGVDVFFVISGFLITSHLYREVERTGTVRLLDFWARRIRRLLPASLLVLAVSLVLVLAWVPTTQWLTNARELIASALYVENWALAADAVDYLAEGNQPSVAQHFWSLSVEEQFYLIWPLLMLAALALAVRTGWNRRYAMVAALSLVGGASFVWSIWATSQDRASAYFITPTRVWEFAIGAAIALVPLAPGLLARVLLGWAGLAAI